MQANWVEEVMQECSNVETPRSWIWWASISAISAAAGNNYFIVALDGKLVVKPNTYTILLGDSGLGKEFPVNLSMELVQRANVTRVIAGRSSIQAIIKELSTVRTREGKPPIMDSRAYIVNGELSTAIIADEDSLTTLTDLYDRKSIWTNLLKGAGAEQLKNPYITTLFGSSPAHFYDSIPQVNIEGGYIGRNFIVFEEKLFQQTDLFGEEQEKVDDFPYEKYVPFLEKISQNSGRIVPTNDARIYFNNWRRGWRENQKNDVTGFVVRVPIHVLKVAMCLSLASQNGLTNNLEVNQQHIEESIDRVTSLTYANRKAADGLGIDPFARQTKLVLDALVSAPFNSLTRKQLLQKGYGNYSQVILDQILDNLLEVEWIKRKRTFGVKADWVIELTGTPLEQYREFLKRNEVIERNREIRKNQETLAKLDKLDKLRK